MSANTLDMVMLSGERDSGESGRSQNVSAAAMLSEIMRSSLGPLGLDKMLVDDIGDVVISNDGATILRLLDVQHPAGKCLVELASLQDQEVGDGTTSVVLLAAELLSAAEQLMKQNIHPTTIMSGYRLACKSAVKYMESKLAFSSSTDLAEENVLNAVKTCLSSKILAQESDFFSRMCMNACKAIAVSSSKNEICGNGDVFVDLASISASTTSAASGGTSVATGSASIPVHKRLSYPLDSINILKAHGKSLKESMLIEGYALNCTVASQAMPKRMEKAKIACIDFNLTKTRMKLGIQVVVQNPDDLVQIRKRESEISLARVRAILKSGANVILSTAGIDDICMKPIIEAGAMAVRRCKKNDLKRICKATGATFAYTMCNDGCDGSGEEESFPNSYCGQADLVVQERICDDELILIKGPKNRCASSIIIRGPNDAVCDEAERSIHDGLCVVKRVLESNMLVAGGGAVETALSVYLENFATSVSSREQMPIAEYANALLIIPKCLATNAAKDACELVSKLRAYHYKSNAVDSTSSKSGSLPAKSTTNAASSATGKQQEHMYAGLDLIGNCEIINAKKAGILEPLIAKVKCIKFATEAAITLLRIDDIIKLDKPRKPDSDLD